MRFYVCSGKRTLVFKIERLREKFDAQKRTNQILLSNMATALRNLAGAVVHYDYMTVSRTSVKYTAISIKVVLKKREKVEYERERLIGKD